MPEVRKEKYQEKEGKNHQIHIFGFHCVAKKYRRMIKYLYFILSLWPHLDKSFSGRSMLFLPLSWMIATLATKKQFLKKPDGHKFFFFSFKAIP
jgi:hypothetical protein